MAQPPNARAAHSDCSREQIEAVWRLLDLYLFALLPLNDNFILLIQSHFIYLPT
jgi:hypothetical protein